MGYRLSESLTTLILLLLSFFRNRQVQLTFVVSILLLAIESFVLPLLNSSAQSEFPNWTRAVAWSPDGKYIALASQKGVVKIVNRALRPVRTLQSEGAKALALAWHGNHLAGALYEDTRIVVWNTETGEVARTFDQADYFVSLGWSPDGTYLAAASPSENLKYNVVVWNMISGAVSFETYIPMARGIAWSPNGQQVAIGSELTGIEIWNPFLPMLERTIETPMGILHLEWSPSGNELVSGERCCGASSFVNVWDVTTCNLVHALEGHSNSVHWVGWNWDGTRLASASKDRTVRIWDTSTWTAVETAYSQDYIVSADWSPDGQWLAYGDLNETIRLIAEP